jgi:hypothetical protein
MLQLIQILLAQQQNLFGDNLIKNKEKENNAT